MRECTCHTPIGKLRLREENGKIIAIEVSCAQSETEDRSEALMGACAEISEYFEGKRQSFSFPINTQGTEFQEKVWEKLKEVPFGQSTTYGELAQKIGHPSSARAVGNAVGKNPLLIVIPCHRVCRGNGKLGGFSAGTERKKALLKLEGIKVTEVENEEKL